MSEMNAVDMLVNLSRAFPAAQQAIMISAYVFGLVLVGFGLMRFLREKRKGNTESTSLIMVIVGSLTLAFTDAMTGVTQMLFAGASPRQILSSVSAGPNPAKVIMNVVLDFLVLIGWISGLRGLYFISRTGDQYSRNGFARGALHLLAGVILINLTLFASAIANQLGVKRQFDRLTSDVTPAIYLPQAHQAHVNQTT